MADANRDRALQQRALALFEELDELPESERAERLAERCAGDAALRNTLERLIAADRDASRVLASAPPRASAAPPPERIGPYRLAELLGVGGMGTVYRGERDDGLFEQTVAVKLVRPGLLSTSAVAQFAAERQILARLEHPNIARLFDGGLDPSGHSYIVMEYLAADSISAWAGRTPDLLARLRLFQTVCGAVQFAHQQLVVHADLKPSNILVTADGVPKLLDFGIARLLDDAGKPAIAEALATALTPAYAAPERAAGAPATVAGDVYSLGVVLMELLTGDPAAARLPETIRPGLLRSDLAAIVAKACAANAQMRYATAAAFTADLERALSDRAVRARPPAFAYRAHKLVRRQRWPIAAAAALLAATTVSSTLYVRAERARADADARFADVRALATYQIFELYDGLQRLPGAMGLRRQVAERAQTYLDRLATSPNASSDVQLEAAAGFGRLAGLLGVPLTPNLGETDTARLNLARARSLLESLIARDPARADAQLELAQIHVHEGRIAIWTDHSLAEARAALDAARKWVERARREPLSPRWRQLDVSVRQLELEWLDNDHQPHETAASARALLTVLDAWPGELRESEEFVNARARALLKEGDGLYYEGEIDAALARYRETDGLLRAAEPNLPSRPALMLNRMVAVWSIATTLEGLGRLGEALLVYDEAVALANRLRELEAVDLTIQRNQAIVWQARGEAWIRVGRAADAIPDLERVARSYRALARAHPADASRRRDLASSCVALGRARLASGDARGGCALLAEAGEIYRALIAAKRLLPGDALEAIPSVNARAEECAAAGVVIEAVER